MKYFLSLMFIFLGINADAQKDYLKNIETLLSLDEKTFPSEEIKPLQYRPSTDELFKHLFDKSRREKTFFHTKMQLLPDSTEDLILKYFNSSVGSGTLTAIQRQDASVKLEFYSRWCGSVDLKKKKNYIPTSKKIQEDFIRFFSKQGWEFEDSTKDKSDSELEITSASFLRFKNKNLSLTILFEFHVDVLFSPFRVEEPRVDYSTNHIPDIRKFIRFIFSKEESK